MLGIKVKVMASNCHLSYPFNVQREVTFKTLQIDTEVSLLAFVLDLLVLMITDLNELSRGGKSKYLRWQLRTA